MNLRYAVGRTVGRPAQLLLLLLPVTAAESGFRPNRPVTDGAWSGKCWSGRGQSLETGGSWPVRQQPGRYEAFSATNRGVK